MEHETNTEDIEQGTAIMGTSPAWCHGSDERIPGIPTFFPEALFLLQRLPQLDLTNHRLNSHLVQPQKAVGMNREPVGGEHKGNVSPPPGAHGTNSASCAR